MRFAVTLAVMSSLVFVMTFMPGDAHAASYLLNSTTCGTGSVIEGAWVASNNTCMVTSSQTLGPSVSIEIPTPSPPSALTIGHGATFTIPSGDSVSVNSSSSLGNYGTLVIEAGGSLASTGSITNNAAGVIENGGQVTNDAVYGYPEAFAGTMTNDGTLNNTGSITDKSTEFGAGVEVESSFANSGTIYNSGTIDVESPGISASAFSHFTNTGTVYNLGQFAVGNTLRNQAGGLFANSGTITIQSFFENYGTVDNRCAGVITDSLDLYSGNAVVNDPCNSAIYSISPDSGPLAGGNTVTLDGTGFSPKGVKPSVSFGVSQATLLSYSNTTISVTAPPAGSAGQVNVTVTVLGTKSPPVDYLYGRTDTMTTLSSSANPAVFGQQVNFTAVVSPASAVGTVIFTIDGNPGLPVALSSGKAYIAEPLLSAGSHNVTASYSGDTNDNPSSSPVLRQVVGQVPTSTVLRSSKDPSTVGQPVTFNATVYPASATGTVIFENGTAALGTAAISGGSALLTTSAFAPGSYTITAEFSGSQDYAPSTSNAVAEEVNRINTTTALFSSANSLVLGQDVTLTATVKPAVHDGETVTFYNGTNVVGTGTTDAGNATFSGTLSAGSYTITAYYPGDANDTASTSGPVTITVVSLLGEKQGVIQSLQSLTAAGRDDRQDLGQAIEAVQDSTAQGLWQADGIHLVVRKGGSVFDNEKQAVQKLADIVKHGRENAGFNGIVESDIGVLVGVDRGIAATAIADAAGAASGLPGDRAGEVQGDIGQAQNEMARASGEASKGQFDAAIGHYKEAWGHAEEAIGDAAQTGHDNDNEEGDGGHGNGNGPQPRDSHDGH